MTSGGLLPPVPVAPLAPAGERAMGARRGAVSLESIELGPQQTPTALLRAVFDEVCEELSRFETGARTHLASRILEAATDGDASPERLKQV